MRVLFLIYGVLCYAMFLGVFLYTVGFVGNFWVPKSMDSGNAGALPEALQINLLLLSVFAVQHSVMARRSFKEAWTKIIPEPLERSTYVLATNLVLILLFWQWRPMGDVVWDVSGTTLGNVLIGVSIIGWFIILVSTFLLDHFELFGLKQVYFHLRGKKLESGDLRQPVFYKVVRHPMYFGFVVAFFATPFMTTAHLLFAIATLVYMLVGIYFEERDMVSIFGDEYREYKSKVSMILPLPPKR